MTLFLTNAAVVGSALFLLWLLSLRLRDASIVDIFWGLGFVLIAWTSFANTDGYAGRKQLLAGMVTLWGLRLALYLAWRNLGNGEDYRYQAMRKRFGERFWLISLFYVFALQGVLMLLISLPLQAAQASPTRLTALDALGALLWAVGLAFEALGDWQLARFKSDPANRGKVMDRGLWALTRHPNYFGDALLWWGYYLIAASAGAWWTFAGPLLMTLLLMKVSGVALLEKTLVKTKPEYEQYIRRTNAFVPWFPKREPTL